MLTALKQSEGRETNARIAYAIRRVCCVGLELEEEKTEALGSQIFGGGGARPEGKLRKLFIRALRNCRQSHG